MASGSRGRTPFQFGVTFRRFVIESLFFDLFKLLYLMKARWRLGNLRLAMQRRTPLRNVLRVWIALNTSGVICVSRALSLSCQCGYRYRLSIMNRGSYHSRLLLVNKCWLGGSSIFLRGTYQASREFSKHSAILQFSNLTGLMKVPV